MPHDWEQFEHPVQKGESPQPYWVCRKCASIVSGYRPDGPWDTNPPSLDVRVCPTMEVPSEPRKMTCEELQVQKVMES